MMSSRDRATKFGREHRLFLFRDIIPTCFKRSFSAVISAGRRSGKCKIATARPYAAFARLQPYFAMTRQRSAARGVHKRRRRHGVRGRCRVGHCPTQMERKTAAQGPHGRWRACTRGRGIAGAELCNDACAIWAHNSKN